MYATVADVQVLLQRELTAEESAAVNARLAWLSARLNVRLPGLAAVVAGSVDAAVLARGIVAEAALRTLSTSSSSSSDKVTSETVGGITLRYGEWASSSTSSGSGLDLTDDEWDLLGLLLPGQVSRGAFTIRPFGAPDVPSYGRPGRVW